MSRYSSDGDGCESLIAYVLVMLVFLVIAGLGANINKITVENAVPHFAHLAGDIPVDQIVVTNHSNNNQWTLGDTHDVTFELLVQGKPAGGRCTSGLTSPIICRLYAAGQGE